MMKNSNDGVGLECIELLTGNIQENEISEKYQWQPPWETYWCNR